jgi:hypothetical protein
LSRLAWVEPLRSMRPRNNTEAHGKEVIRRRAGCWRCAMGSGAWGAGHHGGFAARGLTRSREGDEGFVVEG